MTTTAKALSLKSNLLYQVAKYAWEGTLYQKNQEITDLLHEEYKDHYTRKQVANQIRIAMGLPPHDSEQITGENDEEALMGLSYEPVWVTDSSICQKCDKEHRDCIAACDAHAISADSEGHIIIDKEKCLGDGHCVQACNFGALAENSQFVPLIKLLKETKDPIYASIAPAFAGQFGENVTAGKLRSALKKIGFTEVVETALYADLLTMKEALEFDEHVKDEHDFLITSCCCPVWIKLIENKYPELVEKISPSVSPMIASGRIIKKFEPNAKVVFIGPCIAKKQEIMLPELKGAIDFVLTFKELNAIFEAAGVNPVEEADHENAQASWGGRVYGRTGGVSGAVAATVERLVPKKVQKLRSLKVDGVLEIQKLLEQLKTSGLKNANFIEGMACKGGCVGGPGRLITPEAGTNQVNQYGDASVAKTPVENPEVYTILARFGHSHTDTVPPLTGESPISQLLGRHLGPNK
ncbi:iron only hydrogenase large subunit-like protein [Sporomusaceae bacterium BoRhaA]|uniref:[Fe-Fe] hydrogenase large subunit C-terminal domain-containing protein n=1 Tax=Pelorhabdus rhamnosifermentans TaxID=2772457 RepID=UPI001C05F0CD|nr:[Fe-Fe] hydrogenase large subunit C-terminal domain-containing protein [Pelorhabdus rhamnosifermentans]MBU2703451.1 iron only hydrogenase large subunit-like protein [Pelorhabdus rhamnosifermentans]